MEALRALGEQLAAIWGQLGVGQRVSVTLSGLVLLAGLATVVYFTSRTDFAPLYGRLDAEESGKVISALDEQGVKYQVGAGGSIVMVPREMVHKLRAQLALQDIPSSGGEGYSLIDKPGIGQSTFRETKNWQRAVQGELAKTVAAFDGVESARVMVTMPETRLIVDETRKPTASVFVKLRAAGILDQEAVSAIRFFVANAIRGLKYNNVTVVDNGGNRLAGNDDEGSVTAMSGNRLAAQKNLEKYLANKVQVMLDRALGAGESTVTINAEIDHTQSTSIDQKVDTVPQTVTSKSEHTGSAAVQPSGTPGTPVNINTATNAAANMANNSLNKTEFTTNYAPFNLHKTNSVHMAGRVKRLAAAVFVNQRVVDGTPAARTAVEMEQLTNMVQTALGLRLGEGEVGTDALAVNEVAFNAEQATQLAAQLESDERSGFIWEIVMSVLYVLLGGAALFAFWKLVQRSSEEVIPTGVPVSQLLGGEVAMAAPSAAMMAPAATVAAPGAVGMPAAAAGPAAGAAEISFEGASLTMEEIDEKLKNPDVLTVDQIKQLRQAKKDLIEKRRALAELDEGDEEDVEVIQQQKQKLIMDFGGSKQQPERVNLEVLRDMVTDQPELMSGAARKWLTQVSEDEEDYSAGGEA
ncbi:MAG: flagellar M-ring protein FliF [Verrucomicrobiales bacterium]|nr:flagellar M-ring protein FliF [Verrucomicrobiales bacterium]